MFIKLVIWDLDDTFWKGTLSEGEIEISLENIALLKKMIDFGIMNSIVSKNDFFKAQLKLEEICVWDLFCFPSISWDSKGDAVKNIINLFQLRPENVLFIDDNLMNINEVQFYNAEINTIETKNLPNILELIFQNQKKDEDHSRLKHYKLLEKKHTTKLINKDNVDFLKTSSIKIEMISVEMGEHFDRVFELINRTNQLNYTKLRISKNQLVDLLLSENDNFIIKVEDKFGDYGIVGFYSLDKKSSQIEHFVFSCRILNMGIPEFIYNYLGKPIINIIPEISESLYLHNNIDWITILKNKKIQEVKKNNKTIFFKGGCDLEQILLTLSKDNINFISETNYFSDNNFMIHQEHTYSLLDSLYMSNELKNEIINLDYVPAVDSLFFDTKIFDFNYDCVVYSLLADYNFELYKHKHIDFILPFGSYYNFWTDKNSHNLILKDNNSTAVTLKTLNDFADNFDYIGKISSFNFIENLTKIRSILPLHIPLILINGAEIQPIESVENGSDIRHKEMNSIVNEFVSNSENTFLLDVSKLINSRELISNDNIRHYTNEGYIKLSYELKSILTKLGFIQNKSKFSSAVDYLKSFFHKTLS